MPEAFWLSWMLRTGRPVSELMQMVKNEPEPIQDRLWIYVNAGGV
jgi:hypothetical protein